MDSMLEIISVHIPKTAGSTFLTLLQQEYGINRVFLDFPWNTKKRSPQHKVIHGHFPAQKYADSFNSSKTIVWLRNPIYRLISNYYYWKQTPPGKHMGALHRYVVEKDLDILDFAKIKSMQNMCANSYLKDLKLTDFYFVGIQEFFLEDLVDLKNKLEWSERDVVEKRRNNHPEYQVYVKSLTNDKTLMDQLSSLNSKDMELYQFALSLRTKRKNGLK